MQMEGVLANLWPHGNARDGREATRDQGDGMVPHGWWWRIV